jgi:hypothetical protein
MNMKQKVILGVGIAVAVVMWFVPPYIERTVPDNVKVYKFPPAYDFRYDARMNYVPNNFLLCAQWVVVGLVTGGLVIAFKDKKSKEGQKE